MLPVSSLLPINSIIGRTPPARMVGPDALFGAAPFSVRRKPMTTRVEMQRT
jgi:hypothetical protein